MIIGLTLRPRPSLALLGLAAALAGCVDPKSIGVEPDDDSGSAGSGSDGSGSATSQGSVSDSVGTDSATSDSATSDATGDTEQLPCPPIDIGPCQECTCIDGDWLCEPTCAETCEGLACGDACLRCPDDQPDCRVPFDEGVCTAEGECVGTPPPKLGFCEGALAPGFEADLATVGGCSDLRVYGHDATDERGLVVYVDQGLVAAAIAAGEPVHVELSATDPAVTLEGRAGTAVTAAECNDVVVPEVDVKETWLPSAGTVIVDVVPTMGELAEATVELVDVELHRTPPGPAALVVSHTFSNVVVGWLPG